MSLKFFACNMRKIWFYALYSIAGISILTGCLPKDVASVESDASKSYEGFKGIESAETINDTRVLLKWSASSDSNVVAYNIYDATFKFNPKLIRTVAAPATQVTINGLAPQSLYAFRVRAANDKNEEDTNTEDLNAVPYSGITTAQVLSSTSARLNFTPAENVDEVVVYCKAGDNAQYEQVATVRNLNHSYADVPDLTPGILYTCRAAVTVDGFTDNNPATVQFTPMGQASRIVFTTNPSNTSAGSLLNNQPVITILDANDNVVAGGPDSTAEISLNIAVASPTAGIINGTAIIRAVAGVATFSDLKINESGVKILSATKEDTSAQEFGTAPMSVNSTNFTISPGSASPDYSEILVSTDPV